jgi:alpha-L-fucosidase
MDNKQWFKQAKYGMMIHWGLYSLLAGEYKGKPSEYYAEWIQSSLAIPCREYGQLAKIFNPIFFNADDYVRLAKECGMQYMVFTSKHHDGFAMFDSKVDDYNVMHTPFGRDVTAELAEACYKHGLKFGLYYSQDLDWHEPHGGGYLSDPQYCCGTSWCNNWDYPDNGKKDYSICFENKIMPQVEEILQNYGDLALIWFDVPMTINKEQSRRLYEAVKKYQPDCLINSRLGNGAYDYVSFDDNEVPKDLDPDSAKEHLPSPEGLYETAGTTNDSWGFSYRDHNWKSAEEIHKIKLHLNALGVNYLLNVGPDGLGRIPGPAIEALRGESLL